MASLLPPLNPHPDAATLSHKTGEADYLSIHGRTTHHESPANIGKALGILPLIPRLFNSCIRSLKPNCIAR